MTSQITFSRNGFLLICGITLAAFVGVVGLAMSGFFCGPPASIPGRTAKEPASEQLNPSSYGKGPIPKLYKRLPVIPDRDIKIVLAEQNGVRCVSLRAGGIAYIDQQNRPTTGTMITPEGDGEIRVAQFANGQHEGVLIFQTPGFTRTDTTEAGQLTKRLITRSDGTIETAEYRNGSVVAETQSIPRD